MENFLGLQLEQTKQKVVDVINESKLHPSLVEMMLQNILNEVTKIKIETIMKERELYSENGCRNNENITHNMELTEE